MADPDAFIRRYAGQPIAALPRFWRVAVTCRRCDRRNEMPVAYLLLAGKVDPQRSLAEFARGLRCSICNSRRVVVAVEGKAIEVPPRAAIGRAGSAIVGYDAGSAVVRSRGKIGRRRCR